MEEKQKSPSLSKEERAAKIGAETAGKFHIKGQYIALAGAVLVAIITAITLYFLKETPTTEQAIRKAMEDIQRYEIDKLKQLDSLGVEISAEAYYEDGRTLLSYGLPAEAIKKFIIAVGLKDDYGDAYSFLGNCYFRIGEFDKALENCNRALEIAGDDNLKLAGRALNTIGLIHRNRGNFDEALKSHEIALKKFKQAQDPTGEATTFNNIGLVFSSQGNFQEAIKYHDEALIIHRAEGDERGECRALLGIALTYLFNQKNAKALEYYQKALDIAERNDLPTERAKALFDIAVIYYDQKLMDESLKHYHKSLSIAERNKLQYIQANIFNNIGNIYQYQEKHQEAIDYYHKALSVFRVTHTSGYVRRTHLNIFQSGGEIVNYDEINTLTSIGYSYSALREQEEAVRYTKKILDIDSTNIDGYYNLGCYYSLMGSVNQAIKYLLKGRQYFPESLINASRKDSDLDNIRNDPRFKKIMYGEDITLKN